MKRKPRQNNKTIKRNAVLDKCIIAVDKFVKSKSGTEEADTAHGLRFVKKKSRKELRKEKRQMKKAKMKSHYEGKKIPSSLPEFGENSGIRSVKQGVQKKKKVKKEASKNQSSKSSSAATENTNNNKSSTKKSKKISKLKESRNLALIEANEQEDREIKKLERCLGFNKRKNKKSLPQSFVADGLDYILGVLDSGSSAAGVYDDDNDVDMAKENFEKLGEDGSHESDQDNEVDEEMASEGNDEDIGSIDDEEEDEVDDEDDDEIADEDEAEEEMEEEVDDSNDGDSDDLNEGEIEEAADPPCTKTQSVSFTNVKYMFHYCHSRELCDLSFV